MKRCPPCHKGRRRRKGIATAEDAKALTYLQQEEEEEETKVPERENLDLLGFDVGAEHASGWSLKGSQPKPPGNGEVDAEGLDPVVVRDAGEVNRTQYERVKEMNLPLSDNAAMHLPISIKAGLAPEYQTKLDYQPELPKPPQKPPATSITEGRKMGLKADTEQMYHAGEVIIRKRDRHVAHSTRISRARDYGAALTADELTMQATGGYGKIPIRYARVRYNPLIAPGQTFVAHDFNPMVGPTEPNPAQQMPGSVSSFFVPKRDSEAGNQLEKLVTLNPEATQNLLDRGAVFNPMYRNVQQFPSTVTPRLNRFYH